MLTVMTVRLGVVKSTVKFSFRISVTSIMTTVRIVSTHTFPLPPAMLNSSSCVVCSHFSPSPKRRPRGESTHSIRMFRAARTFRRVPHAHSHYRRSLLVHDGVLFLPPSFAFSTLSSYHHRRRQRSLDFPMLEKKG